MLYIVRFIDVIRESFNRYKLRLSNKKLSIIIDNKEVFIRFVDKKNLFL